MFIVVVVFWFVCAVVVFGWFCDLLALAEQGL